MQAATILERRRREALQMRDAPQRSERAGLASTVLSWQRTVGNQRVARALAARGEPPVRARPQPAAGDLALAGALSRAAAARVTRCPGYEDDETCPCELGLEASEEPRLARQPVDAGTPAAGVGPPEPTDAGSPAPAPVDAGTPSAGPPAPAAPALSITRTGGNGISFISTDSITLAATQPAPATGAPPEITWTVNSASANSGTGTPHTGKGATFSFTPNPTRRPTAGSHANPNPPIKYRVDAKAGVASTGFDLEQDETDTIRQEYVDYRVHVPDRSIVVAPTIATYNTGNYSLIVDGGMDTHLAATTAEFARLTQAAAPHPAPPAAGSGSGSAAPAPAPAPAPVPVIRVSSGYRNPQRNKAVGSLIPASNHVMGHALDLALDGANATLWARLRKAGAVSATSICEHGPTQVECSAANVDHVHIGW